MVTGGEPLEPDIVTDRIGRVSPIRGAADSAFSYLSDQGRRSRTESGSCRIPGPADDRLDLALLKVDGDAGLNALELGKEDSLLETAPVITFGFPFGRNTTVGRETCRDMTVLPCRITALRRDKGRLEGVQFFLGRKFPP